ncbi:MAG: hypothetical protein ACLP00_08015 [Terracidiphilus sp.]
MSRPRREKESKRADSSLSRPIGWRGPAIIVMAAVVAAWPLLVHGPSSCSGDFGFHLISWLDAEHSMSTGLLYPHWADSPNFGAGEPRFVFYPPIGWMGGAVLGMFLPWSFVPLALVVLLLAATGMANRALAREVLPDGPATLAGCAAIFLGYALFCVYKRNDFAELEGGFWIPLLLLFALRRRNPSGDFWERALDGSAAPLALVVAGAWLSNGPVAIMACYLLAAVALVSTLIEKSPAPVVRATVSTCAGMGLASLYLIPAVWERNWVNIQSALTPSNYVVENSWLFARHADPLLAPHDLMLQRVSVVAVAMLAIAFGGGAVAWIRGAIPGERRWWLPLALIPPVVLIMLLPISEPVWRVLPELRLLQFPWRWLVVLEAPMSICFAAAVWFDRKPVHVPMMAACAAVFVGISFAAPYWWFLDCGSIISSIQQSWRQGIGVPGKPEYAPPGIRFPQIELLVDAKGNPLLDPLGNVPEESLAHSSMQILPVACLLNSLQKVSTPGGGEPAPAWHGESASCNSSTWRELSFMRGSSASEGASHLPEKRWIGGVAEHAGYLILRLRYYPAWSVKVNGISVKAVAERERGLLAVPVPQGNVLVSVDWRTTGDVVAGRWVSGVALLLVAGLYWFERERQRAQSNPVTASASIPTEITNLPEVEPKRPLPSTRTNRKNTPPGKPPKNARRK